MKIAVLSDTHIPLRAKKLPQELLDNLKNIDMIIHAGDFVEAQVLKDIKKICPRVVAVYGNMDCEELRKELKRKEIVKVGKFKIGITHGYGNPQLLQELVTSEFAEEKPDIIVYGHSHNPRNEFINGVLYFNPGSSTDKFYAPYNSYGIIEINDKIKAKIVKIKGE